MSAKHNKSMIASVKARWIVALTCGIVATTGAATVWGQADSPVSPRNDETRKAERRDRAGGRMGGGRDREVTLPSEVTALKSLSVILGCPTDHSVVVSVLTVDESEGYVEYGLTAGKYTGKTDRVAFPAGKPTEITIRGLKSGKRYFYRVRYRKTGENSYIEGKPFSFHTQRAPGSTFMFEIQGDSHPERTGKQFDAALYSQLLRAAEDDRPDFYMTIGDDFSVDTLRTVNAETVRSVYLTQRLFLSQIASSAPIFLVNGNHEQAAACNLDGTPDNVAVWAQTSRNRYFPQPTPDSFYTGDAQNVEHIGLLRDYYSWTWGNALFVVIDPYWHSSKPVDNVYGGGAKSRDQWGITLGDAQYKWLTATLERSKAKYKFVFSHHVLGTGRGGIEQAELFEWGGKDKRGGSEFATKRPGWPLPIHQLMVKSGVTI
ncbi:MAG: metallophosphoesterase family protein, partial [Armatimonadota bacterium]